MEIGFYFLAGDGSSSIEFPLNQGDYEIVTVQTPGGNYLRATGPDRYERSVT